VIEFYCGKSYYIFQQSLWNSKKISSLLYYPQKTTAPTDHKPQPSAPAIPPKSGTQQRLEKPLLRMYFTKPFKFTLLFHHMKNHILSLTENSSSMKSCQQVLPPPQWC
jgi:hypothetical protein